MKRVLIELTHAELMVALQVGGMRRLKGIQNGARKNLHAKKSDWQTDVDGAAAEIAVAKYLGVYWSCHIDTFKAPDVAGFQVRSTLYRDGHLIVRPNDPDGDIFVLVTGEAPRYCLAGALRGGDAKREEFVYQSEGEADCWRVPQHRLEDLPAPRVELARAY